MADELARLVGPTPPPFALLYRPESADPARVELLVGDVSAVHRLADLPVPDDAVTGGDSSDTVPRHEVLALVPYRQVVERGYVCRDDQEPILAMTVSRQSTVPLDDILEWLPVGPVELADAGFEGDDESYTRLVRAVLAEEIGTGAGSNFVVKRTFRGRMPGDSHRAALALFRELLAGEVGAYWTFLVHTGTRTFVGATPERQVSVRAGEVVMNPISGTYRYPVTGPDLTGTLAFLADRKEAGELVMVVDEELKMMAGICEVGGQVLGPYLKEMARLAHTEYLLRGRSSLDVREVLRRTLLAPTVTGSPVENACRVIARRERVGRGYYSGVIALVGRDGSGRRLMDSAILIRTADIDQTGGIEVGVGATLVRDSDPDAEVAETEAKVAGLLAAAGVTAGGTIATTRPAGANWSSARGLPGDERVDAALRRRNATLSRYWFDPEDERDRPDPYLAGRRVLVLDAEDTFTAMLGQQLRSLGTAVTIRPCGEALVDGVMESYDLVVAGPGPGDPRDRDDSRVDALWRVIGCAKRQDIPLLCVCLSHQVLASALGLDLVRKPVPNQGVQLDIELFGRRERVGFYNTYVALSESDVLHRPDIPGPIRVCRDPRTREVHALRGPGFASTQFHPESLLTQHGVAILAELLASTLTGRRGHLPLQRSG
ncbi:MAG: phenazine-specific anthranilate synthase component I [Streptosporangiales bacterium]|nr:phenazine-specific anthranilate synthase component I [Streptosporangiales bacterium]